MKAKFDKLNRFEIPKIHVCNPGSFVKDRVLTNSLGCLSATSDEELILNFNALSELNFRIEQIIYKNASENDYFKMLYNSLQNRRLLFLEDIGYFVISDVKQHYANGAHYKDVQANSIEAEIQEKLVPYIEDGTYLFTDLLEKLVGVLPLWKIGNVNGDVAKKYRTFEDVGADKNILSFMQEDMQDAYECIFLFDIIKREISVVDQNTYFRETDIHITKDDLINTLDVSESSDSLYTALTVQGDDNLNISPVNPLGANVIYDFSYYLGWMSEALRTKVTLWQKLIAEREPTYYNLNLKYYESMTDKSNLAAEVERLNAQIEMYQRCRENIVANGSTVTVESYNKVIEKNGGVPIGVQDDLAKTVADIEKTISSVKAALATAKSNLDSTESAMDEIYGQIQGIHDEVAISKHFTEAEYTELANYIFEGSYTDEYISVNSLMTYSEKFEQMKTLYDRAKEKLTRISQPTYEFSLDVENFIFAKHFAHWSEQLEAGCLINVDLGDNDVAPLFLSRFTVNYDDKKLKMTFGNRFSRFDPKALFNNVLGNVKKSANSINYIKEILYPVREGEFDLMKEAIESSGVLTKERALASTEQEIMLDDTGLLARKRLDNGDFDPRQVKLTNQSLVFTDDGWQTAKTAVGSFLYNNPLTGKVEDRYGVIADTLIGNLVLSEEVGIFNPNNSIRLDKDGFTLTNNGENNQNTFVIQRKRTDKNGNEYYEKQLYIDNEGNLVLNGTIGVYTGGDGDATSLQDLADGVSSTDERISKAIEDINFTYFFVRYSPNQDGSDMTVEPEANTAYMGVCNVHENKAPTDPKAYQWSLCRGINGVNSASISLYKRSKTPLTTADSIKADLTYTFATSTLSGDLNGWSKSVPAYDGSPCYIIQAVAASQEDTDTIPAKEWSAPVKFAEDGSAGHNTAIVYLYRRSSTAISAVDFTEELTYNFADKKLTSVPNGWSQTIQPGTDPIYVTTATAYSTDDTDTIGYKEWSAPVVLAQNGADGKDGSDGKDGAAGANGLNSATVFLYQRATTTPAKPSATLTYTFKTGVLSGTLGNWTQTVPEGTNPCYIIHATAVSTGKDDTIPTSEWSAPAVLVKDGANGKDGTNGKNGANGHNTAIVYLYRRSSTAISAVDFTEELTYNFADKSISGTVISETATLVIQDNSVITKHPASVIAPYGSVASISVETTGNDLVFQWQYRTTPSSAWNNCTSATPGYNTATISPVAEEKRNGYQYHCVITDRNGNKETSAYATLTVQNSSMILQQPSSYFVNTGAKALFTVSAIGAKLSYQWQWRTSQNGTWQNCTSSTEGYNTETLRVDGTTYRSGYQYRCVITDIGGFAGWTQTIPEGTSPIYVTMANAYCDADDDEDTIAYNEWCTPVVMAKNGTNGKSQYLHIKYSDDGETFTEHDGDDVGAYIGILVNTSKTASTTFSDYQWKKFTEDMDDELAELQKQINDNNSLLSNEIQNTSNNLLETIRDTEDRIKTTFSDTVIQINDSVNNKMGTVSSEIDKRYSAIMDDVNNQLTAHKTEIGQYMTFDQNGLTLGATSSVFKTLIDNTGMYFKQGDNVVSYVSNNQLYIPNAVIEATLMIGNFFWTPRNDGSMSLVWKD